MKTYKTLSFYIVLPISSQLFSIKKFQSFVNFECKFYNYSLLQLESFQFRCKFITRYNVIHSMYVLFFIFLLAYMKQSYYEIPLHAPQYSL